MSVYAQSVLLQPPPHILGMRVRPFCLYHSLLLRAMNNAYWPNQRLGDVGELASAVFICSTRFHLEGDNFSNGELETMPKKWALKWRRKVRNQKIFNEHEQVFRNYIEQYTEIMPIFSESKTEIDPYQFESLIVTKLMAGCSIPEERAWNMPFGLALNYITNYAMFHDGADVMETDLKNWLDDESQHGHGKEPKEVENG